MSIEQNCEEIGWNDKGHGADCELLHDTDLRRLFLLDWEKYDIHVQFPLPDAGV